MIVSGGLSCQVAALPEVEEIPNYVSIESSTCQSNNITKSQYLNPKPTVADDFTFFSSALSYIPMTTPSHSYISQQEIEEHPAYRIINAKDAYSIYEAALLFDRDFNCNT